MSGQPIIPCAVGTGSIRLIFYPPARLSGHNVGYIQVNYAISGTFATFIPGPTFATQLATKLNLILANQIYTLDPFIFATWQLNTPTNAQIYTDYLPGIPLLTTPPPDVASGFNIQLRSANTTRSGRARIHWPFLYPGDHDGSHITAAGKARLVHLLTLWRTTLSFGACRLTPVIWSRKHNIMNAVTSATISNLTMTCRKRQPHWFNRHGVIAHCP